MYRDEAVGVEETKELRSNACIVLVKYFNLMSHKIFGILASVVNFVIMPRQLLHRRTHHGGFCHLREEADGSNHHYSEEDYSEEDLNHNHLTVKLFSVEWRRQRSVLLMSEY